MSLRRAVGGSVLISLLMGSTAGFAAGSLELVSRVAPGQVSGTGAGPASRSSYIPFHSSLSDDGRYAVFHSYETNLVPGERDLNQDLDIFVQDLLTGTTALVSHAVDSPATAGNTRSGPAVISGDGRWVVYTSRATDLVPGLPPKPVEPPASSGAIYLYDRAAEASTLITNRPPNDFNGLTISEDGRYIAFASQATDLVPGQRGAAGSNIFLYDRVERSFQLVSHASASLTTTSSGLCRDPVLSADGRWVAFLSPADDLAPGKPPGEAAFLWDRISGTVTLAGPTGEMALSADGRYLAVRGSREAYLYDRVTRTKTSLAADLDSVSDFSGSSSLAISADGRYVALKSPPGHLVPPQPGGVSVASLFLYDQAARTFTLVSRKLGPAAAAGYGAAPSLSADGRLLSFVSYEPDLVTGQVSPFSTRNVFLFDRDAGRSILVSHAGASATTAADGTSYSPRISADGTRVLFDSQANNLAAGVPDLNQADDTFVYTAASASLAVVSHHPPGQPSITPEADSHPAAVSGDGRWVAFESYADHLVAGQSGSIGYNIFLYDRATRTTILVSHAAGSLARAGHGWSFKPAVTPDGRWILFTSSATDLVAGTALSGSVFNYFLFDRLTGTIRLVGRTEVDKVHSSPQARITPDGRWAVFVSDAADVSPGQQGHRARNVFLWDRLTGSTTLVSHSTAGPTVASRLSCEEPQISDDGRWIAFASLATDLVPGQIDGDLAFDLFLWDRTTGKTALVSHAKGSPLTAGALQSSSSFAISATGGQIAFASYDQIEGIEPGVKGGLYLYDRTTAALVRIFDRSGVPAVSADGRYVVFSSYPAPGVEPAAYSQVFLHDRSARTTTLLSRSISGDRGANGFSDGPAISADGRYVAFASQATDLVPRQSPPPPHEFQASVFLVDRLTGTTTRISVPDPASPHSVDFSFHPFLSASGHQVAFTSSADLVAGDLNNHNDAYLFSLDPPPAVDGPVTVPPCALFSGPLRSNARKVLKAAGACGVPAGAKQVAVRITVSQGTGKGNVRLYPGNVTTPAAGILRFERGATRAANFTLPLSTNGTGTLALLPFVAGNGTVRVAVEVNGYTP